MIEQKLRDTIQDIRRKPYPISDLIPLFIEAADELDNRAHDITELIKINNDLATEIEELRKKQND